MINWLLGALLVVCLAVACLASLLAFPYAVHPYAVNELRTVETVDNCPCKANHEPNPTPQILMKCQPVVREQK